jgi:hypothetical protein
MLTIAGEGAVSCGRKGTDASSCAFPAVCVLPGGRWLCGWRAAPTKAGAIGQHVLACRSDDEGRSWSEPEAPFGPLTVGGRPGLFRGIYMTALGGPRVLAALMWTDHSRPDLPFFHPQTQGLLDTRIFLARSEDAGGTWSRPQMLDASRFDCPTPITGPVLRLPGGDLLCPFELNKHYEEPGTWRHAPVVMISTDGGASWPLHALPARDPSGRLFFWDQRSGVLADGTVLDLFWTYDTVRDGYLNIHASDSRDGGRSWSAVWDTGLPGQPAQPVSLRDGRIALAFVDRSGAPSIRMRVSADGGRSWPADTEVLIHAPRMASQLGGKRSMHEAVQEMEKFSVGLPNTAPLEGGDVLVVYYAGPEADRTDVRWARVRADG